MRPILGDDGPQHRDIPIPASRIRWRR